MADTFQLITGLPEDRPKVYNLAGRTTDEAMKMLRYLKRNAFFGTHTGLPKEIRNSKINESLISNIGDYSVIDVYATSGNSCQIGTVVNFFISDNNNPMGSTYVYPCTDKDKPMGYMISNATPDKMGVCLVHGVLEVPLAYPKGSEEIERGNYVEYDLENSCFKFANSGYPVFNVYQDVDGDWIAIILFGDIASDYEYDGPFAVSVAGVTGSTTYINVNSGDVLFNDIRGTYDEDLTTQVALNTGESVWLKTSITGNTHAYDLIATSTTPIDGSTVFYTELAKNVDGNIVQNQYGDIRYLRTKLIAGSDRIILSPANGLGDVTIDVNEGAVGTTQDLTLTGSTVLGSTASIGITDSISKINIVPENDLYVRTGAGTNELIIGSTTTAYIDVATSVSGTNDASISFSNINGLAKTIHIKAGSNIQLSADGTTGIIVSATGGSVTPYVQDLTHSFSTGTATLGLTGSAITVSFTTVGNTYIEEGSNGEIVIGSTSGNLMCASTETAGLYSLYISDTSDSKVYLKEGIGISLGMSGSTITITGTTYTEGTVTGITSSVVPNSATISTIGGSGAVILSGGSNTYIESGEDGEIVISTQTPDLSVFSDTLGTASLNIIGSASNVNLVQGSGISISVNSNNEVVISSTSTGMVTGITSSISGNTAFVSAIGGTGGVMFYGVGGTTISSGENGEIVIGSTVSGSQDLSYSVSGGTAFIGITGGSGFNITSEGNTYIKEDSNGFIIGSTCYQGPFATTVSSRNSSTIFVDVSMGTLVFNNQRYIIYASSNIRMYDGSYLCLHGIYDEEPEEGEDQIQLSYWNGDPDDIAISSNEFYTKIAYNNGGVLEQIQYGEITCITFGSIGTLQNLNASVSGGTAFIGITGSTNTVKIKGGSNASITAGSTNEIVINGGTSGGGSGLPAPNWSNNGHDYEIILDGQNLVLQSNEKGWLYAFAEIERNSAGAVYKGSVHVVVNGGSFKVCSSVGELGDGYSGNGSGIVIPIPVGATISFVAERLKWNGSSWTSQDVSNNDVYITGGCVVYLV